MKFLIKFSCFNYGFRWYMPDVGRFLGVDPLAEKFAWLTAYQYAGNTPVQAVDLDGLEPYLKPGKDHEWGYGQKAHNRGAPIELQKGGVLTDFGSEVDWSPVNENDWGPVYQWDDGGEIATPRFTSGGCCTVTREDVKNAIGVKVSAYGHAKIISGVYAEKVDIPGVSFGVDAGIEGTVLGYDTERENSFMYLGDGQEKYLDAHASLSYGGSVKYSRSFDINSGMLLDDGNTEFGFGVNKSSFRGKLPEPKQVSFDLSAKSKPISKELMRIGIGNKTALGAGWDIEVGLKFEKQQ